MGEQAAIRVGVIGTGFGAKVVAPVLAATEGIEVAEVVSARDASAVRGLCERGDLDVVSIHSPPFLHLEHVRRVVEAGHAVACDKPFGRNAAEAEQMCELAQAAGVANVLNFEFRHDAVRQELRRLVLEGAIGEPQHFQHSMFFTLSRHPMRPHGWLFDRELGGGWIGAFGSHVLDFARWTFGEVSSAAGLCSTDIPQRPDASGQLVDCSAEDGFTASLRFESGATALIDSSFAAGASLPPSTLIIGSEAALVTEADQAIALLSPDGSRQGFDPTPEGADPFRLPMQRWAQALRDLVRGEPVSSETATFADGLACARIMDELRA
jgi:predicted dehydrogenase